MYVRSWDLVTRDVLVTVVEASLAPKAVRVPPHERFLFDGVERVRNGDTETESIEDQMIPWGCDEEPGLLHSAAKLIGKFRPATRT